MAFESLTDKLQDVFKDLRSKGRLTEADVKVIQHTLFYDFFHIASSPVLSYPKKKGVSSKKS